MNIRDLQYLVAVADNKHFGKAAEACFVSQPTLSMQLKKLEQELGVTLFERNSKHVLMTSVGEKVIAQARCALRELEQLPVIAAEALDPYAGDFKLGIIPTVGPYLLPLILPSIKQQLPQLTLIIIENKTDVIVRKLQQGELDAIILALPINEPALVTELLYNEPFYLALSTSHELASKKNLHLKDIENADLLLLEEGHCLRDQALEACSMVGAKEQQGYQATSLETLRHMVAANLGITLLPKLAIKYSQETPHITTKPFSPPSPSRDIGMLWRNSAIREQCCFKLCSMIKAVIRQTTD